ncbi:hypothetical protein F5888DRAFT_1887421 [Russula emetica]|nr:hypothetical protein F5888DRAFT_1887421 [Russula emetica]
MTGAHAPQPNSKKRPWTDPEPEPEPDFDWNFWMNKVNEEDPPRRRPAPPKEFGQAHEYQVGHAQQWQPNPTGPDPDFDWDHWTSLDDSRAPPSPPMIPASQIGSLISESWGNPWSDDASIPKLTTKPDSDPNLMAAHQPPLYPLSSTVNPPSTESYLYSHPGSVVHHLLSPGAGLPTITEHGEVSPPLPDLVWSPKEPEYEVVHHPPSPNQVSLEKLQEPEAEVANGPPPSPELTDPENSDYQPLSADSQPVDLLAAIYAAKGKAKESSRISATTSGPEGVGA